MPHLRAQRAERGLHAPLRSCRCTACAALPGGDREHHPSSLRFWLAAPRRFARVAIDFDPAQALFSLYCFRGHGAQRATLVNAMPNRYRLRELEATLVELSIELPESLRRYFLAVLGEDEQERALREREVRALLCSAHVNANEPSREHAVAV